MNTSIRWHTTEDNLAVACADCPDCSRENVVARVASARSGFNSTTKRTITCKQCHKLFAISESQLDIRRYTREAIDAEYGLDALPWIE